MFRAFGNLLAGVGFYTARILFGTRERLTIADVVLGRPIADLLLDRSPPITGVWVIAKELRTAPSSLLFELLKEVSQCLGIVARLVHDDRADGVSLCLIGS